MTNVYEDRTVVEQNTIVNVNHVELQRRRGGIQVHASAIEMQAANEHHFEATGEQVQHLRLCRAGSLAAGVGESRASGDDGERRT